MLFLALPSLCAQCPAWVAELWGPWEPQSIMEGCQGPYMCWGPYRRQGLYPYGPLSAASMAEGNSYISCLVISQSLAMSIGARAGSASHLTTPRSVAATPAHGPSVTVRLRQMMVGDCLAL